MDAVPTQPDEAERLRVLRSYGVLDTPSEPAFDDLATLAAQICGTPIALVALEDRDRQWFKSHVGIELTEAPRTVSFCVHGSHRPGELLLVTDAPRDARFADNPFVTGAPHLRFYAGAPLVTDSGHALGTLCVIDRQPRELSPAQQDALRALARQVVSQLELRRALAASRESEERYRVIFNRIPIPLFVVARDTSAYLGVNDAAIEHYGYSREEFLRLTALDLRPEEDRPRLLQNLAQPAHELAPIGRWRHRRKDGSLVPVEVFAHDLTFDGHAARIVLAVDVTEQARAVAALEASEARFRALSDSAPLGIFECDATGKATYRNGALLTICGRTAEQMRGTGWMEAIHPEDRATVLADIARDLTQGCGIDRRHRLLRPDGTVRWVHLLTSPQLDEAGRPSGYVGTLEDITHQHLAGAALAESEERFRQLMMLSPDSQYVHVDERVTLVNPAFCRLLGAARATDLLGKSIYDLVHPDCHAAVRARQSTVLGGEPLPPLERKYVRLDGTSVDVEVSAVAWEFRGRKEIQVIARDITQRKLAADKIRELAEMLNQVQDAIIVTDLENRYIYWNAGAEKLYGWPAEEALGKTSEELFDVADGPAIRAAREETFAQGQWHGELNQHNRHGQALTVESRRTVIRDQRGQPAARLSINVDITARKRAEEELRSKTALLQAQFDSTAEGILVVERLGKKIIQNHRFVELLKIPPPLAEQNDAEATLRFVTDSVRHRAGFAETVRHLSAHPEATSRDEIELNDGTVLDRYSSPVLGADGKNYGRIWTFRDITAAKAAEAALRLSEERFKLVARAVSDAIWDWNMTTGTVWRSDNYETVFGLASTDAQSPRDAWTGRIHPDDRSRVLQSLRHAIDSGRETWGEEYRFLRRDGSYAYVRDRGQIVRDSPGRACRVVGGMTDLTEQKKLEVQFLRAQRMESIGTLAGGIAHDLNNVLTPILMSISLLQESLQHDADALHLLSSVEGSTRRGADLVRQVLSFARGVEGERTAVNFHPLLKEVAHVARGTFSPAIAIVTDAPADLWHVSGDPTQLHQVLMNLAVNARDAMPDGGTLTLAAENLMIDDALTQLDPAAKPGPHVLLRVSDTGHGIPPAVRERIFEPFFTTKPVGQGTGLGLSTVHAIVRSHGGHINVYSEVGQGTTFKVHLPANPRLAPNLAPAAPTALPRGHGECVLVIDDEPSILQITRRTLESFGYRVLAAQNGADALAIFTRHQQEFSLVLTDIMMPVMDGTTAIDALRRIKPDLRIIASSGLHANEARAASAGVNHFLSKPYTVDTLVRLIREVLDAPAATATP